MVTRRRRSHTIPAFPFDDQLKQFAGHRLDTPEAPVFARAMNHILRSNPDMGHRRRPSNLLAFRPPFRHPPRCTLALQPSIPLPLQTNDSVPHLRLNLLSVLCVMGLPVAVRAHADDVPRMIRPLIGDA